MVKFQSSTVYAIRMIGYLHMKNNALTHATEMSEELGVSYLYLMKILNALRTAKIVCSVQGCKGGYRLAKNAADITVYDVVKAFEGDIYLYKPVNENPTSVIENDIESFMFQVQDAMVESLKNSSIKDVFENCVKIKAVEEVQCVGVRA